MTGGAGADNFYFVSGDGQDVITDFEIGIDTITIDGLALDVWLDGANWSVVSASETTFSVTSLSGDALTLENVDGLALFNNFLF
jgi:Ca2+-binding RTX toxin-like protein